MRSTTGIRNVYVFMGVLVALACLRSCFAGVLWSDEDYHMAAAIHILHGKMPYRDFWYDKPPLAALYYLLEGALPGLILRLWDATYILLCCFLAHKLAKSWWGEVEGRVAALLVAFFTTFYLPAAVIPFAPDALLIAPHLAAIYFARQGKAWAAGVVCGVGFWINVKALFVLVACALWALPAILACAGVMLLGGLALMVSGTAAGYGLQVWVWGIAYAPGAPVPHPFALAAERIGHWLGFHAALMLGWLNGAWHEEKKARLKLAAWLAISFAAVCLGNHFAPRYFFQMLPPLAIVAARGIVLATRMRGRAAVAVFALLLLVPFLRFAPRYVQMAAHRPWRDIALNLDSQQVAGQLNAIKHPGDTLFVWGYRPDMYVYTRLSPAGLFWDSQPLTGVAADRHLTAQAPRRLFFPLDSHPTFIVDGLGLLNDNLKPQNFVAMQALLSRYHEVARTRLSVIYQRND